MKDDVIGKVLSSDEAFGREVKKLALEAIGEMRKLIRHGTPAEKMRAASMLTNVYLKAMKEEEQDKGHEEEMAEIREKISRLIPVEWEDEEEEKPRPTPPPLTPLKDHFDD